MTKTKQVAGFDLAAKWQKKRYGLTPEEGWFILFDQRDQKAMTLILSAF